MGIDFSPKAIAVAHAKAKRAGAPIDFRIADVTRVSVLAGQFEFALDVGCFHGLDAAGRTRYVEQLACLLRPGGKFMLWALDRVALFETYGIAPKLVEQVYAPQFTLTRSEQANHRSGRTATWYWFTRRDQKDS